MYTSTKNLPHNKKPFTVKKLMQKVMDQKSATCGECWVNKLGFFNFHTRHRYGAGQRLIIEKRQFLVFLFKTKRIQ